MNKNNDPMACDLETGICGTASGEEIELIDLTANTKKATIYYVTDPICSHCWALEPVFRRFLLQYGHYVTVKTVMGGLLEKWDGFADVKNGISRPADVAEHWREVGEHSRMPIDGSVWLENPIASSYPASRVFKVVQEQNEEMAHLFLRRAREAVFAFNRNIADDAVLTDLVRSLGLEGEKIVKEAHSPNSQQLLMEGFSLARNLGATGFPSLVLVNEANQGVKIVGARPFETYVKGLEVVLESENLQAASTPELSTVFATEKRLFSREIEELYGLTRDEVKPFIEESLADEKYEQKDILGEFYIEVS